MPPKKNRSTNNKKTKTKVASSNKNNNDGDNENKNIYKWVKKGNLDAKTLSRKLPDVADAIREGKVQPDEVPKIVQEANQNYVMNELKKHLPDIGNMPIIQINTLELATGESDKKDLLRWGLGRVEMDMWLLV